MKPRRPRHTKTRKDAVAEGYRSGLEKAIADDLIARGIPFEYERFTIRYSLPIRGGKCLACASPSVGRAATYTPDFRVGAVFVESKGYFTARDRTKLLAVKLQHPGLDIRLLFGADNWCTTKHKQRYSEWAAKHGFVCAVGKRIPEDWLYGRWLEAAAGGPPARGE